MSREDTVTGLDIGTSKVAAIIGVIGEDDKMEVTGVVKTIMEEQVISEKFRKREFVLTLEGEYPQDVIFQTAQDNVDKINDMVVGQECTVGFNLRGREWTSPKDGTVRYFNTLDAWKIDLKGEQQPAAAAPQQGAQSSVDDLPF